MKPMIKIAAVTATLSAAAFLGACSNGTTSQPPDMATQGGSKAGSGDAATNPTSNSAQTPKDNAGGANGESPAATGTGNSNGSGS